MASQEHLTLVQNKKTGSVYYTRRNKKGDRAKDKLKLKKYDPITRKQEVFEEVKKLSKLKKNK
jgi:ribosomal protein L33